MTSPSGKSHVVLRQVARAYTLESVTTLARGTFVFDYGEKYICGRKPGLEGDAGHNAGYRLGNGAM